MGKNGCKWKHEILANLQETSLQLWKGNKNILYEKEYHEKIHLGIKRDKVILIKIKI